MYTSQIIQVGIVQALSYEWQNTLLGNVASWVRATDSLRDEPPRGHSSKTSGSVACLGDKEKFRACSAGESDENTVSVVALPLCLTSEVERMILCSFPTTMSAIVGLKPSFAHASGETER